VDHALLLKRAENKKFSILNAIGNVYDLSFNTRGCLSDG